FFFFQAEDGIRDLIVTGVQTCALPISGWSGSRSARRWRPPRSRARGRRPPGAAGPLPTPAPACPPSSRRARRPSARGRGGGRAEIGRASCRERGEVAGGAG